jgi:uncharacterized protein YigE (DUF2233 family)
LEGFDFCTSVAFGYDSGVNWKTVSWSVLFGLLLSACGVATLTLAPTPLPTQPPHNTQRPTVTPLPTLTPEIPDTGWISIASGLERRHITVHAALGAERITVVRVVPAQFSFQVHAAPGEPRTVQAWHTAMSATLTINAGYFDEDYQPLGLVVADEATYGVSYDDFAGMFAVRDGGEVAVRWLREHPYQPAEPLQHAVQSFPVLVKPGGIMGFPADADDGRAARRAVVAQDTAGRLLFIIAPRGYLSLHVLADWLASSDLEIDVALNLDGGTSAGLWVTDTPSAQIDSLTGVPVVIVIERS